MSAYVVFPLLLAAASPAAGGVYQGRIVAVTDGQSMVALIDHRRVPVRIAGIEAPTGTQRHAIGSRQSLIATCGSEPARIEVRSTQADGTLVARVVCNGVDAGAEQVRRGMAAASSREADGSLGGVEADARAAKRGLWSNPQAAPER